MPHTVFEALGIATGLSLTESWLVKGVEREGRMVFSSRSISEAELREAFVLAGQLHSKGWKIMRTSNRANSEEVVTFEPPHGLVQVD